MYHKIHEDIKIFKISLYKVYTLKFLLKNRLQNLSFKFLLYEKLMMFHSINEQVVFFILTKCDPNVIHSDPTMHYKVTDILKKKVTVP